MARVSWRDYGLLGRHLQQTSDLCWAISLTCQFQHLLRFQGFIQPDQELSIQQRVNVTPRFNLEPTGEVIDIRKVAPILEKYGSMFAHERPFTQLPNSHIRFDEEGEPMLYGSFFPTSVVYNVLDDYIEGEADEADETEISHAFDQLYVDLRMALDEGPVTARIPIYEDSYNSIVGKIS